MVRHIGLRRFMTHIRKMSSTSASDSETRVYHEEGDGGQCHLSDSSVIGVFILFYCLVDQTVY